MEILTKSVTQLSQNDLLQLRALFKQAFCHEKGEVWSDQDIDLFLLKAATSKFFVLAYQKDEILGYGSAYDASETDLPSKAIPHNAFYTDVLIIAPTTRNKGLGTKLVKAQLNHIQSQQLAQHIVVRCRSDNPAIIKIYQQFGFREIHRYELDWKDVSATRLIYSLDISSNPPKAIL